MHEKIPKYKSLLLEAGNVISASTGKPISYLHISSLESRKTKFTGDVPATNLIIQLLDYIDVYNNGKDIKKLEASSARVNRAMAALARAVS